MKYLETKYTKDTWNKDRWNIHGKPLHNIQKCNLDNDYLLNIINKLQKTKYSSQNFILNQLNINNKNLYITFICDTTNTNNSFGYYTNESELITIFPSTFSNGKIDRINIGNTRQLLGEFNNIGFFIIYKGFNNDGVSTKNKKISTEYTAFLNDDHIIICFDDSIILRIDSEHNDLYLTSNVKNVDDIQFIKYTKDGFFINIDNGKLINKEHNIELNVQNGKIIYDDLSELYKLLKNNTLTHNDKVISFLDDGNYVSAYEKCMMYSFKELYHFVNMEAVFQLYNDGELVINAEFWKYPQYLSTQLRKKTFMKFISIIYKNEHLIINMTNLSTYLIDENKYKYEIDESKINNKYIQIINDTNFRKIYHTIKDPLSKCKFVKVDDIIFEFILYPNIYTELNGFCFPVELLSWRTTNKKCNGCFINNKYIKIVETLHPMC